MLKCVPINNAFWLLQQALGQRNWGLASASRAVPRIQMAAPRYYKALVHTVTPAPLRSSLRRPLPNQRAELFLPTHTRRTQGLPQECSAGVWLHTIGRRPPRLHRLLPSRLPRIMRYYAACGKRSSRAPRCLFTIIPPKRSYTISCTPILVSNSCKSFS